MLPTASELLGLREGARTCAEPQHFRRCPVPVFPMRKGSLNQSAFSLFLLIQDICGGDLVRGIDPRLAVADLGDMPGRAERLRAALLEPLSHVYGVSFKVLSMALADLLLGGDPGRKRWVTAGGSMIVVDTLVHNFLH